MVTIELSGKHEIYNFRILIQNQDTSDVYSYYCFYFFFLISFKYLFHLSTNQFSLPPLLQFIPLFHPPTSPSTPPLSPLKKGQTSHGLAQIIAHQFEAGLSPSPYMEIIHHGKQVTKSQLSTKKWFCSHCQKPY